MVQILVGPDEKRFDVHKELLCSVSDFFSAALNGGFKEAATGVVKLPEQDTETFQYFVHWLYSGKLTGYFRAGTSPSLEDLNIAITTAYDAHESATGLPEQTDAIDKASHALNIAILEEAPIPALVSLHVLADTLHVRGLKDYIIIVIVKVYAIEKGPANLFWYRHRAIDNLPEPIMVMNDAYEKLPSVSTLRRFIIEFYLSNVNENPFAAKHGLLASDFTFDYLVALQDLWYQDRGAKSFGGSDDICRYHEHDVKCLLHRPEILETGIWEW